MPRFSSPSVPPLSPTGRSFLTAASASVRRSSPPPLASVRSHPALAVPPHPLSLSSSSALTPLSLLDTPCHLLRASPASHPSTSLPLSLTLLHRSCPSTLLDKPLLPLLPSCCLPSSAIAATD
ncbi:hypothetical protein B296_00008638 [Ensete ventricosum]|uniref:Uncharacterized protein n=1 Tax=Ensete ventricosum TaxID=4639 RepID=A0A427A8G8_ENSVE|nr:hypothetical protein B296_00008638 [Ensete ventricosum]